MRAAAHTDCRSLLVAGNSSSTTALAVRRISGAGIAEQLLHLLQQLGERSVMPRVFKGDALHLAYATFYKCDFLLTWNCNHLANANKRQHIRIVNARLNLPTPEIVTPLELFTEVHHDDE